jgi:hypothetical protein
MVRLETVLDSWREIRQDTASAVEEFPPDALDATPIEGVASFRETARHVLDAGAALAGLLLEGMENFQSPAFRERLPHLKTPLSDDAPSAPRAAVRQKNPEARLAGGGLFRINKIGGLFRRKSW